MKRWQFAIGVATTLCALLLVVWVLVHERKTRQGFERLDAHRDAIQQIATSLGRSVVRYENAYGVRVLISEEGEDPAVFMARCEQTQWYDMTLEFNTFCWESDCTRNSPPYGVYHIQICAPDQATLDALVEAYCNDTSHTCDGCP